MLTRPVQHQQAYSMFATARTFCFPKWWCLEACSHPLGQTVPPNRTGKAHHLQNIVQMPQTQDTFSSCC